MLGLSFAAVPLYDLLCRVTGFGGTTQISKEAPKIIIDEPVRVRFDTNVQTDLAWNFKAKNTLYDVKPGKVYKVEFEVENFGKDPSSGVASYNVSPSTSDADVLKMIRQGTPAKNKMGGAKIPKKSIMELPTNVPRLMKGANLMNPDKADLNKHGKLSGYEKARG